MPQFQSHHWRRVPRSTENFSKLQKHFRHKCKRLFRLANCYASKPTSSLKKESSESKKQRFPRNETASAFQTDHSRWQLFENELQAKGRNPGKLNCVVPKDLQTNFKKRPWTWKSFRRRHETLATGIWIFENASLKKNIPRQRIKAHLLQKRKART
jgi:hypothetical protein